MVSLHNSVFFVYLDLASDGRVFYVGKGLLHRVQLRERNNAHWKHIAAKHGWRREIVLATKNEQFAFDEEKRLIREHKTFYGAPDYVWGANKTEGGEGPTGYKHTAEWRAKHTGVNHPMYGKKQTARYFARQCGWKLSPETVQNRSGENSVNAKLTWNQVDDIRRRYASNNVSQRLLAKGFGISQRTLGRILSGETWKRQSDDPVGSCSAGVSTQGVLVGG